MKNKDWVFGHFSYDLKNEIEDLKSENKDFFEFDKLNFFIPYYIFKVKKKTLTIIYDDSKKDTISIYNKILNHNHSEIVKGEFSVKSDISKKKYLSIIDSIKNHIQKGDIYEMNFCKFKVNLIILAKLIFYSNNYSQSPFILSIK